MRDKGLNRGLVQTFDTSSKLTDGAFYGFRKMFWEYLNKLGVPFYDPCCPEASTAWAATAASAPDGTIAAGVGGPIPVNSYKTTVSTDLGGDSFTLANGVASQQKRIDFGTDGGGDAVITPANLAGGTTITLNDAGDYVILVFNGTEWVVSTNSGAVVA